MKHALSRGAQTLPCRTSYARSRFILDTCPSVCPLFLGVLIRLAQQLCPAPLHAQNLPVLECSSPAHASTRYPVAPTRAGELPADSTHLARLGGWRWSEQPVPLGLGATLAQRQTLLTGLTSLLMLPDLRYSSQKGRALRGAAPRLTSSDRDGSGRRPESLAAHRSKQQWHTLCLDRR